MFFIKKEELLHFRILFSLVKICGILYLIIAPTRVSLKNIVLEGDNHIEIKVSDNNKFEIVKVTQKGKISPNRVIINEATYEELICCPGIGSKKASAILEEREKSPFISWNDFQKRIKSFSNITIDELKDAGVQLNKLNDDKNYEKY